MIMVPHFGEVMLMVLTVIFLVRMVMLVMVLVVVGKLMINEVLFVLVFTAGEHSVLVMGVMKMLQEK